MKSSQQPSDTLPSDPAILGNLIGMETMPDGQVVYSSVPGTAVEHSAIWRSSEVGSLFTVDHEYNCLMLCSPDGRSAHTEITRVTQPGGSEASQHLANYDIGPSRQYKFCSSVPYTKELLDAMRTHMELVERLPGSDGALLRQIKKSFEITELIMEVGDSFLAKARSPIRGGPMSSRLKGLLKKVDTTVPGMSKELKEPFKNQAGKLSFEAIKYLALALHDSQCFQRQENMHPDFDVEELIKSILIYLCICFERFDSAERAKFHIYYG